ncbi:MAG: rhomboid family intramembrane serine protease [Hyphomicrobiaceae bacterium]|nr:rhomboid family intramembrane serine protease [Hyphomicrobiaceae bacterium]
MQPRYEPVFNVPAAVTVLIGIFIAVHVVRGLLPTDLDDWWTVALAFVPARYNGHAEDLPGGEIASVTSFLTHMLVHGDVTHLMFNSAWFLAFGGAIALRVGAWRFLALMMFTGVIGASAFLAVHFGEPVPVVGASGAVSGMMGAVMRFLFSALDSRDIAALRETPERVPLMSLGRALTDRRVLAVTGVWLLLNLVTAYGIPGISPGGAIAWEAHVGGYFAGLMCFGWFDRRQPRRPTPLRIVH